MSQLKFAVKHDRTLEEARGLLQSTVADAQSKFGFAIDKVDWNADKSDVNISAKGALIHAWVDSTEVHLTCEIPALARLLASPVIQKVKALVETRFQKKLTQQ
jgi:hypothetical protein